MWTAVALVSWALLLSYNHAKTIPLEAHHRVLQTLAEVHVPTDKLETAGGAAAYVEDLIRQHGRGSESKLAEAIRQKYGADIVNIPRKLEAEIALQSTAAQIVRVDEDQCGALHGAIAAEQLLQPMDQGDFQSHFWGRKPFLLARHKCKTNYDKTGLGDWGKLFPSTISGMDADGRLALLSVRRGDLYVNLQKLYANPFLAYLDGVSTVLNSFDCHFGPLASFLKIVRDTHPKIFTAIGAMTVNAYITPAGAFQAFPLHNDEQDVFVMQISGRKRWRVFNHPSRRFKGGQDGAAFGSEESEADALQTTLEPGDLLYLPRKHKHEGWTVTADDDPTGSGQHSISLSLTYGFNQSQTDLVAAENHATCQAQAAAEPQGDHLEDGLGATIRSTKFDGEGGLDLSKPIFKNFKIRPLQTQVRKRLKNASTSTGIVEGGPKAGQEMTVESRVTDRMVTTLAAAFQKLLVREKAGEQTTLIDLLPDNEAQSDDPDQYKALSIAVSLKWLQLAKFVA